MAYGCALAHLSDYHLAEDVAQESFLIVYAKLDTLNEPIAFPAWLRRIVDFQCARLMRTKAQTEPLEAGLDIPAQDPSPYQQTESREMRNLVRDAIKELPEAQRLVTTLFYLSGHSTSDVARMLA